MDFGRRLSQQQKHCREPFGARRVQGVRYGRAGGKKGKGQSERGASWRVVTKMGNWEYKLSKDKVRVSLILVCGIQLERR